MIYPRLALARTLLTENGTIFVSIDDGEVERLRAVMAEIFGEENFLAQIAWQSLDTTKNDAPLFSDNHEYIVGFARSKPSVRMAGMKKGEKQRRTYKNRDDDPRGDYLLTPLHAKSGTEAGRYTYTFRTGQKWSPPPGTYPRYSKSTLESLEAEGRLYLDPEGIKAPQRKTYWSEVGDRMPAPTFWNYETFGSTRQSNKELADLVGKGVFQNPKPSKLIRSLIDIMGVTDGIVLDFFAGSGTTGHAVLDRNADEGTTTQFILVQLPEVIDPDARSQREASELCQELGVPLSLAELTKHRLRRVIEGLEVGEGAGFRVFKLDSSNIVAWDPARDDLEGSLLDSLEHIKGGRSETDILFELIVKLGLELTVLIETREVGGVEVRSVGAGTLMACLANSLSESDVESVGLGIADWHRDLNPVGETTVVFRDDAFESDVAKTNMTAILEQRGLATVRSL
jgi:adenine-specific DNA-methyltransferase